MKDLEKLEKSFFEAVNEKDVTKILYYVSVMRKLERDTKKLKYKMSLALAEYQKVEYDPANIYEILKKNGRKID